MQVMGIDAGTTGVKAAVFDEGGEMLGYGFEEYSIQYPGAARAEQDAEHVWTCTKQVMAKAAAEAKTEIAAISISVQGDAVIPIDENRHALAPAHLGMDYRGVAQARRCAEIFGEKKLFHATGMRPHPLNSLIKILWIMDEQPELARNTATFATYSDFLLGKLGSDQMVIDHTMASRTMAFELESKTWSTSITDKVNLSKKKLSTPVVSGTVVGTLSASVAAEVGISKKAKLVAGGHDQTCAALGAGVVHENMALDSHGTAEVISTCFSSPHLGELMFEGYYPCYCNVLPGLYFTFALNHTGGVLLKWYRDELGGEEVREAKRTGERSYEQIVKTATKGPSPLLMLPHLGGSGTPTCDVNAKGAILGLTLASSRQDIAKALMESLALEMRLNIETLATAGVQVNALRCVGGGARSAFDLQLKADVLGIPVSSLQTREAACFGAASLALYGIGALKNPADNASLVKMKQTYTPNPAYIEPYNTKYCLYKQLYATLRPISHQIARLNAE